MPQQPNENSEQRARRTDNTSRSQRRKKKRRMNPLVYILLVTAVSALLAGVGWIFAGDMLALNKAPHSAIITVSQDDTVKDVADMLKEQGLVEFKPLFKLFCLVSKVEAKDKIVPGTYELNTDMDYHALVNAMSNRSGNRLTTSVTIPEGYTIDQVFALLEEKGVSNVELLQDVAANYDFKFSFLKDVLPLGDYHRLEGYLFPDTYTFYMGGGKNEAVQVLNKMIVRFDQMFTEELRSKCVDNGFTIHEILTIASLIEKETDGTDRGKISSVIRNRLNNPNYETAGYLQIDASIAYVTGKPVVQSDYQFVESVYNTYLYKGLPPGPIANPGIVSILAALAPENTKYYYYVLGEDNLHHFFRTNAEFESYKATLVK